MSYSPVYTNHTIIKAKMPETILYRLTKDTGGGTPFAKPKRLKDVPLTPLTMTVDDDLIDLWALDADDEIDTACNGRYTVPFNPVPKLIERIATVLTMYYLCQRWGSDNPYKALYEWAMKKLAGIADGSISIIGIDEADSFASSGELEAGIEWAEFNLETDYDTRKGFIEP